MGARVKGLPERYAEIGLILRQHLPLRRYGQKTVAAGRFRALAMLVRPRKPPGGIWGAQEVTNMQ